MLRDYQIKIIAALRNTLRTHRRPVVVAPCGSGKTHIAAEIVKNCQQNGASTLFLAPRRELIYQTLDKFTEYGIEAGMIMAGEPQRLYASNQVASFDTLHAWAIRRDKIVMPPAKVVIVDECHLSLSKGKQEILSYYKDSIVIGLTATPCRGDGKGLGEFYDSMVNEVSVRELMDLGHLVEPEYYAPSEYDLSAVKQNKSDYIVASLERAVDQPKLIGEIYENWERYAVNKRTVIFCTTRKHSRHVCELFRSHGIRAEHVDGETERGERAGIFERVRSGETQVLCNVFVASFGLDIPPLECCVLARPTKNLGLYHQTSGRVLRASPGKQTATIIDHTGAIRRHGFLDDPIPWTLDGTDVRELKEQQDKEREAPKEIICTQCGTVFSGQRECPKCGHQLIPRSEDVPVKKANLVKVKRKLNTEATPDQKIIFYGMLKYYGNEKGYNPGWAFHKYKERFHSSPDMYRNAEMRPPSHEVRNYITSRQIAYANRR